NDHELLDAVDRMDELGRGALERGEHRFGARPLEAEPLIRAVSGALHQPELLDVARNRRLRRVEAALLQAAAQELLAVQWFAIDELQNDRLPARARVWNGAIEPFAREPLAREADVVFLALPDGAAADLAPDLVDAGIRVVDLSGAFRLSDAEVRAHWYPDTHRLPAGVAYGLT